MRANLARAQISYNIFKTWLIMLLFSLFAVGVVYIFAQAMGYTEVGGLRFLGIGFIIAGIMNFISYFWSDKIVLAISRAKKLERRDNLTLFQLIENLCRVSRLPTPKIYLIEDTAPNAFATGRSPKHSAIAFTTGILQKLDKQELEGVAAHELSHVGNRDTLLMSVVSVLVGTIALLSDWFLRSMWFGGHDNKETRGNAIFMIVGVAAAILAPIVAILIQLAISRQREFLADASGALLTHNPVGLAKALLKISGDRERLEVANRGTAHLYIVNPLKGQAAAGWFAGLFNTHPPIETRIKALQEMGGKV